MFSKWSPSFRVQYHSSLYVGFPSLIPNFLIKGHSNCPSKCETLCNCNLLTFIPRSCQHLTQQTCRRATCFVLSAAACWTVYQFHPYLRTGFSICQPRIRHAVLRGGGTEVRHSVISRSHWHFCNLWYEISCPSAFSFLTCWLPEDRVICIQHDAFYVLLTVHLGIIFVNNQLDAQLFFMYVYFYSLHVSGSQVPIVRRINCINTTSGICHPV